MTAKRLNVLLFGQVDKAALSDEIEELWRMPPRDQPARASWTLYSWGASSSRTGNWGPVKSGGIGDSRFETPLSRVMTTLNFF